MMFTEQIGWLREERQIPQRVLVAALEIDTATYCKIEKGGRKVRREQVLIIAEQLMPNVDYLMLSIRNDYRGNGDFSKIFQFFETLYINGRLRLPLKGIVLIGY
jgi:DNA-binding XRE family transcriptional regulator